MSIFCDLFRYLRSILSFFFNATATTEIYTLSLHDALPIFGADILRLDRAVGDVPPAAGDDFTFEDHGEKVTMSVTEDRKSTRLNSSHRCISYAVFCLKKKKQKTI